MHCLACGMFDGKVGVAVDTHCESTGSVLVERWVSPVVAVDVLMLGTDYPFCASLTTQSDIAYFTYGATYYCGLAWVVTIAQNG